MDARGIMFLCTCNVTTTTLVVVYRARLRLAGLALASDACLFPLTERSLSQEKLKFLLPGPP